jgi:CDP-2,3-bis-(O-geranylgeranyl)-sn-glycerol synthase
MIEEYVYWLVKFYIPVMVANGTPVLVKGTLRIDFGRDFIDKRPLLGSNKTWEGLLVGVSHAFIASSLISIVFDNPFYIIGGFAGFFGLLGDLAGAFLKRRLGIKPGDPLPVIDQLDFVAFSTPFYLLIGVEEFVENPSYIVLTFILILLLHVATNNLAYYMGLKDKRW